MRRIPALGSLQSKCPSGRIPLLRSLQAFFLVSLASSTGLYAGTTLTRKAYLEGHQQYDDLSLLTSLMSTIDEHWVGDTEHQKLMHGAALGMTETLDPHSLFLDPDSYQKIRESTDGVYYGIGVEYRVVASGAWVTRIMPNSPAEKSDIRERDIITTVESSSLSGLNSTQINDLIRGPKGQGITLQIQRESELLTKKVVRDQVVIPAVQWELIEPGFGYAQIEEFQRRCAADLWDAVQDLEEQSRAPLRGMILDLRNNPGGLLEEAVAVSDLFLRNGLIVEVRGTTEQSNTLHTATLSDKELDFEVIVLVNGESASAAEIVAGSLQIHDRAQLVGTTTFGKGSVQKLFEFQDGSALKLTTARYFLPDGRSIEEDHGLTPDHIVATPTRIPPIWGTFRTQLESSEMNAEQRNQLLDLLNEVQSSSARAKPYPTQTSAPFAERLKEDQQLQTAVHLLRSKP